METELMAMGIWKERQYSLVFVTVIPEIDQSVSVLNEKDRGSAEERGGGER